MAQEVGTLPSGGASTSEGTPKSFDNVTALSSEDRQKAGLQRTITKMAHFEVDAKDLRATYASVPLAGAGRLLRPRLCGGRGLAVQKHSSLAAAAKTYDKSFPVKVISMFWSHSWRAPHWNKIIVLMFFYNGVPAAIIGTIGACIGCALAYLEYLPAMVYERSVVQEDKDVIYPFSIWSTMFGVVFYLITLVFWRSRKTIFLDKVCIHQTDEILRRQGIEAIGAYLRHSKEMLVLWDPSYVTRLWCVFELAAFLYAHQRDGKPRVLCRPVILGPTALTIFIVVAAETAGILLLPASAIAVFVGGSSFVMLVFLVRLLRRYHSSLATLRMDFKLFALDRSGCYCCNDVNHKLQGCSILCDRKLVEGCIKMWFGTTDRFDQVVQNQLFDVFESQLGVVAYPYATMLLSLIPVMWAFMDLACSFYIGDARDVALSQFLVGLVLWVGALPSVFAVTSTVAASRFVQAPKSRAFEIAFSLLGGAACTFCIGIFSGTGLVVIAWFGAILGGSIYVGVVGAISLLLFYVLGARKEAKGALAVMNSTVSADPSALSRNKSSMDTQPVSKGKLCIDKDSAASTPGLAALESVEVEWC